MWEHPQLRKLLQIGNEVFPNPAPSPSSGNPLLRSLESSETKTLAEWESGYVVKSQSNDTFSATPKNGYGLSLTLMPLQSMGAETFRNEVDLTPTTYAWFNVDAPVTAFTYTPPAGKKRKVNITLPSDFAEYIVSSDGVAFPHDGMGSIQVVLNSLTQDSLRVGGVISASIADPNIDDFAQINLPVLSFTTSGTTYSFDSSSWGRDHKMVFGAYSKGYGYNIPPNSVKSIPEGKKAYGGASIYEELTSVDMVWYSENDVGADDEPDCTQGYTYNSTTKTCEVDSGDNGDDDDEDDEGLDTDTLLKYGLYGFAALAALSMLKR